MENYDRAFIFTLKSPHGVEPTRYRRWKTQEQLIMIPNMTLNLVIILLIYVLLTIVQKRIVAELQSCLISNMSAIQNTIHRYMKFNKTDKLNSFLVSYNKEYTHQYFSCLFLQQLSYQLRLIFISVLLL